MSDTALATVQEIIERSLFEAIRVELVDKLYLPDIADNVTYPNTQIGWDKWKADIKTIADGAKGFAIEIFSGGSSESRGIEKIPRIVMDSGNFLSGALGGDPRKYFLDQGIGEPYKALVTPPQTVDFYINFHLISNTIAQSRILNSLLALAIPRRGYLPWYNSLSNLFFIRYLNYFDQSDIQQGIIEHVYAYEIPDAWDREDIELAGTIAKISEITLNINLQKYMDGSWGYDSDPMVIT